MSDSPADEDSITRRQFIEQAAGVVSTVALAGCATTASPFYKMASARAVGANDRIRIGHIGLGEQGLAHAILLKRAPGLERSRLNIESAAVCDLYGRRLSEARKLLSLPESAASLDYRKLLENKDLDAVLIATSENWHAQILLDSLEARKHCYLEKPLCRTIEEAFRLYDRVKASPGTIVQIGTQSCSDPKWIGAAKAIRENRIGQPVFAQGRFCRNSRMGEWNRQPIDPLAGPEASGDAHVDWRTFSRGEGPSAWDADRFFHWRKYHDYGNGIAGDFLPHTLNSLMMTLGSPTTGLNGFPTRVSAVGRKLPIRPGPAAAFPRGDTFDFFNLQAEFGDAPMITLSASIVCEYSDPNQIRGDKATLLIDHDQAVIRPERIWAEEIEAETLNLVDKEREPLQLHQLNFLDAIRGKATVSAGIELSLRAQVVLSLAHLSLTTGQAYHFDPATRKAST